MSSGGWELVGRNKKDKSNGKITKLSKAEKKKFIENSPKVEDFRKLLVLTPADSNNLHLQYRQLKVSQLTLNTV